MSTSVDTTLSDGDGSFSLLRPDTPTFWIAVTETGPTGRTWGFFECSRDAIDIAVDDVRVSEAADPIVGTAVPFTYDSNEPFGSLYVTVAAERDLEHQASRRGYTSRRLPNHTYLSDAAFVEFPPDVESWAFLAYATIEGERTIVGAGSGTGMPTTLSLSPTAYSVQTVVVEKPALPMRTLAFYQMHSVSGDLRIPPRFSERPDEGLFDVEYFTGPGLENTLLGMHLDHEDNPGLYVDAFIPSDAGVDVSVGVDDFLEVPWSISDLENPPRHLTLDTSPLVEGGIQRTLLIRHRDEPLSPIRTIARVRVNEGCLQPTADIPETFFSTVPTGVLEMSYGVRLTDGSFLEIGETVDFEL